MAAALVQLLDLNYLWTFLLVVMCNFLGPILACDLQNVLQRSMLAKHTLGLITMYFAVLLVSDKAGDATHPGLLIVAAICMYVAFMAIARCTFPFLCAVMALLAVHAGLGNFRAYYETRAAKGDDGRVEAITATQAAMWYAVAVVVPVGVVMYLIAKRREYSGDAWSTSAFVFGVPACKFNG